MTVPNEPVTCTLGGGAVVVFDVPDTTADDYDDTWVMFDVFTSTVGAA